jgi:hypothetical protein
MLKKKKEEKRKKYCSDPSYSKYYKQFANAIPGKWNIYINGELGELNISCGSYTPNTFSIKFKYPKYKGKDTQQCLIKRDSKGELILKWRFIGTDLEVVYRNN